MTAHPSQRLAVSLLIDIQAKMQEGKGKGYENWAKVFNIKQMASSMSYMTNHGIKTYDELSAKVDEAVKKTDTLPEYVIRRMKHNLTDVTICDNGRLLCFFNDDSVRLFDLKTNADKNDDISKILSNKDLLNSGKVGTGGYFVTFNDSIDIPAALLYDHSAQLPLTMGDFLSFVRNNIPDTAETCRFLSCTRQNLAYMQDKGQLSPVKSDVKGNLFLKGDVIRNMW